MENEAYTKPIQAASESIPPLRKFRLGYISIAENIIWEQPQTMKAILEHFVPVQIIPEWEVFGQLFRYIGYCEDFDLIDEGSQIPQYNLELQWAKDQNDDSKGIVVHVKFIKV